jgi:hypothetical protein
VTDRIASDIAEVRLNHLIDRARRGALLPAEADQFTTGLRDLVRRLEDTEDDLRRVQQAACRTAESLRNAEQRAGQAAVLREAADGLAAAFGDPMAKHIGALGAAWLRRRARDIEAGQADQPQQPTTSPLAGIEVRQPCPFCGDHQMIPRSQFVEHVARLHPEQQPTT